MLILGRNEGLTQHGKSLKDGALCVVDDARIIFALAEERLTRQKQAAGTDAVFRRLESQHGLRLADVDHVATSSCCETQRGPSSPAQRVPTTTVNHHLSHACAAYFTSPFDEAIVAVVDAGGNLITSTPDPEWWCHPREQHSYFVGRGNTLRLAVRDCHTPYAMGLGEFYRAITHFLGWPSSEFCGNVMALAGSLPPPTRWPQAFELASSGDIHSRILNRPHQAEVAIETFLRDNGLPLSRRLASDAITDAHREVAAWAQAEVERAFFGRIRHLMGQQRIFDLCLAGGFALNCTLTGKLWDHLPVRHVAIPVAPGDSGQCLGNALFVRHLVLRRSERVTVDSAALGGSYGESISGLETLLNARTVPELRFWTGPATASTIAQLLTEGRIVGLFNGRSEFGPRALGHRSILADPRSATIRDRLNNSVKKRDSFMPYAPSVLLEASAEWFRCRQASPFMQFAFPCSPPHGNAIPAVTHVDGTARVQTVTSNSSPTLYRILQEFFALTGVPVVLNTSLNARGEPIVETPEEALDFFASSDIDAIAFGDQVILARPRLDLSARLSELRNAARPSGHTPSSDMGLVIPNATESRILLHLVRHSYPYHDICVRRWFGLLPLYLEWLKSGRKQTTIRYRPGALDLPGDWTLPIAARPESDVHKISTPSLAGIQSLQLKEYRHLSYADASSDGFTTVRELKAALESIYGHIPERAVVSIYTICLKD